MNFILIVILAFFTISGNQNPEINQKKPQEKEIAKKEISEVVGTIFRDLENMDAEALFLSYLDSPETLIFMTNGLKVNLQEFREEHDTWFKTLSTLKVTPYRIDYNFISDSNVVCSWQGKFEMTLKSGAKARIERFGITFILQKKGNSWKVIHQHSSSLPPVKEVTED